MDALEKFIVSQKKKKLNERKKEKKNNLKIQIFKYNSDPKILTGQIEKLTNYPQRKRNLEN